MGNQSSSLRCFSSGITSGCVQQLGLSSVFLIVVKDEASSAQKYSSRRPMFLQQRRDSLAVMAVFRGNDWRL